MTLIERLHPSPVLTQAQLLRSLGVPHGAPVKKRLLRYVADALELAAIHAQPRILIATLPKQQSISLLGPSRRLARYLDQAESVALVVGTAGTEWSDFLRSLRDPMLAYVCNGAATALARDCLAKARSELARQFPTYGIADTLSPGTNGLPLRLQTRIAALLPLERINVTYDPGSMILSPLASVTALIAFGNAIEPRPISLDRDGQRPPCRNCQDRNCLLRVAPYQSKSRLSVEVPDLAGSSID